MAFRLNERDVKFVLFEQLGIERLFELEAFKEVTREDLDMILGQAAKLAINKLQPMNKLADEVGAHFKDGKVTLPKEFKDAYAEFSTGMWNGVCADQEFGGMGLPFVLNVAANELFMSACVGFVLSASLTSAGAGVISDFYKGPHRQLVLEKMTSGEWAGTMCLTEPSAGSDVGALKTTAKPVAGKDTYSITGGKIFISSGDHDLTDNIIHLVLARVEGSPPGPKGISLFVVPKYKIKADGSLGEFNDVSCVRIEEKMGLHGNPTSQLSFGDSGKCEGWLIGQVCEGMRYMFKMMNEERINIGIQGVALSSSSYFGALDYAKERLQFTSLKYLKDPAAPRMPIINHPDVRRMLLWMKSVTEGMRALLLRTGLHADLAQDLPAGPEKEHYQDLLDLLTPVCKAYCSDMGFRICETGVQVLGGYGYCREYPLEQYLRDEKIASIYEGTNGIQALDLLSRKLMIKGGGLFTRYAEFLMKFVAENKDNAAMGPQVAILKNGIDALIGATKFLGKKAKEGVLDYAFLQAVPYLEMFGHVTIFQLLVEQAIIAGKKLAAIATAKGLSPEAMKAAAEDDEEIKFLMGKVSSANYFGAYVMPQVEAIAKAIQSENRAALDMVF